MTDYYAMRPDKVAFTAYGDINYAEMVLKYSGISNPFSLNDDDVLVIPSENTIYTQLAQDVTEDEDNTANEVRNYYKFKSSYKSDDTTYKDVENTVIKSGVVDTTETNDYIVPYITEDGTTAITIRNGRMYFGEDNGNSAATNLDAKIQQLINSTATAISDNCAMNGMGLADFIRAGLKSE